MRKHSNSIWVTSFRDEYQSVRVSESDQSLVTVAFLKNGKGYGIDISRRDARLLAKRINQCLDNTQK